MLFLLPFMTCICTTVMVRRCVENSAKFIKGADRLGQGYGLVQVSIRFVIDLDLKEAIPLGGWGMSDLTLCGSCKILVLLHHPSYPSTTSHTNNANLSNLESFYHWYL